MFAKVTEPHESGVRFPVNFYPRIGKAYGEHVDSFRGYVLVQGRSNVSIFIDDWHKVDGEFKDKLWTNNVVFIINFMICFTSINGHLKFLFNTNINFIMQIGSVYCFR